MLQGQGQWKGDIKVIEVKGQGHFANFQPKRYPFYYLWPICLKWGKMVREKHQIIDKILKSLA